MDLKYENFTLRMIDSKWLKQYCLFACVSGAHSFGWVTPQSDLDVRFVVLTPIGQLVSPFFRHLPHEWTTTKAENIDAVEYPIQHYLGLLSKGNGNAVDNLFEPKLAEQEKEVMSLQQIVKENIHKGFINHCLGYSISIKKDFENPQRIEKYGVQKLLLCRYRVLLQGFNLINGRIDFNLPRLLAKYPTNFGKGILNSYINGLQTEETVAQQAIDETTKIHYELAETLDSSDLPSFHHSNIIICLDRWIKKHYLGNEKTQVCSSLSEKTIPSDQK
jgi:hypothetical protein